MTAKDTELNKEAYQWLGMVSYIFLQQSAPAKAIAVLEFLDLLLEPSHPQQKQLNKQLAYAYLQNEQFDQAVLRCEKFLEAWPQSKEVPYVYFIHAQALAQLGQKEKARQSANRYLNQR